MVAGLDGRMSGVEWAWEENGRMLVTVDPHWLPVEGTTIRVLHEVTKGG